MDYDHMLREALAPCLNYNNFPKHVFVELSRCHELAGMPFLVRVQRKVPDTSIEVYGQSMIDPLSIETFNYPAECLQHHIMRAAAQFNHAWVYWATLLNWSA